MFAQIYIFMEKVILSFPSIMENDDILERRLNEKKDL